MIDFGTVRPGTTLYVPFATYDSNDPSASVTMSGFAVTDIEIYKNGSTTQRASDNGYALLDTDGIDFDSITGIHGFSVDLSDNSDAGFYAAGAQYTVVVSTITVDAGVVSFIAATFRIGQPNAVLNTTIASLSSQTSFTLTAGPAEDDALNDMWLIIHDVASAVQMGYAVISDYTGSSKTVTLAAGTTYTAAATDNISIMGPMPMQPTVAARKLDVSTGGEAGVDWANVGSPTTAVGLSGTTVKTATDVETDTQDIQGRLPAALTGAGNIKADALALSGDATAADNAESFFDGTGYAGTNNVIPTVTTLTNAPSDSSGVTTLLSRLSALRAGYLDNLSAGAVALASKLKAYVQLLARKDAAIATDNAAELTEINANGGSGAGAYVSTTDSHEALRDRGDAAWATATGFSTLDASGVRSAVGLASANLDTQLDAIPTNAELATALAAADDAVLAAVATVDSVVDAIKLKTDSLGFTVAGVVDVNIQYVNDIQIQGDGQTGTEWGPTP